MSGEAKQIGYQPFLECYFDAHMHIQSGKCAPLPVLWRNLPSLLGAIQLNREDPKIDDFTIAMIGSKIPNPAVVIALYGINDLLTLDTLSNLLGACKILPGAKSQLKPTYAIGDEIVNTARNFLSQPLKKKYLSSYVEILPQSGIQIPAEVFFILFAMTFDMEYAHIAGYDGKTIYQKENEEYFYRLRKDGQAKYEDGKKKYFTNSEKRLFVKWDKQVYETKAALCKNPWNLMALYHYDPRRWDYGTESEIKQLESNNYKKTFKAPNEFQSTPSKAFSTSTEIRGTWNFPFTHIVSSEKNPKNSDALFLGFKMYTPHGYRPFDEKCRYLIDFYAECSMLGIPIVNHCSPGGNLIPELKYYKQFLFKSQDATDNSHTATKEETPENFFKTNFIDPKAWVSVLQKNKGLKICLAHLGGDLWNDLWHKKDKKSNVPNWITDLLNLIEGKETPNVYTDISCFNYTKKEVQANFKWFFKEKVNTKHLDRIMFGTDWYLSGIVGAHQGYNKYCAGYKTMLDNIDPCLWARFTVINPFYFYRLDNPQILENYKNALLKTIPVYCKQKMMTASEKIKATKMTESGVQRLTDLSNKIISLKEKVDNSYQTKKQ